MQKLLVILSLFTAFQFSSISSMEQPPSANELSSLSDHPQFRRLRSLSIANNSYDTLTDELLGVVSNVPFRPRSLSDTRIDYTSTAMPYLSPQIIEEHIDKLKEDIKPFLIPPAPSKPRSFYAKNKRFIWAAAIGAGTLAATGILLRLVKADNTEKRISLTERNGIPYELNYYLKLITRGQRK